MKRYIFTLILAVLGISAYAQNRITGTVTSASDGEPLIGVAVYVNGTDNGASTDIDGRYTLDNVASDAVIVFSIIGFDEHRETAGQRGVINVSLNEESIALDDVVVIGYGTVKKSDLTSSISTVTGDRISEVTTGNAMDALQGKVLGVQVANGGGPGSTPRVLIRGVTTVNGSNPLYVVDGMPVGDNINFLNNDDIASMEVLKDASASAIYGTRGSNGVILITTKKGRAGRTNVHFSSSVGVQTIANPGMARASEYEQVFKARYSNDGSVAPWVGKDGVTDAEGTDWWNETIKKAALVQNYSLGITGGSEKFIYSLSLGYFRNDSHYDYGYYDKINIRLNTEYRFNKYVKLGIDLAPRSESWDDTPDLLGNVMSMDPTTPVMLPEDQWTDNVYSNYARARNNQTWNPVAQVARMNKGSREFGIIMNPYVEVTPIKGLSLRSQFGINAKSRKSDEFSPKYYIDLLEKSDLNTASREMNQWFDWNWTNTVNYSATFAKKHNLNVMAGFTAEKFSHWWVKGSRDGIPNNSENLQQVGAGTLNQQADGSEDFTTLASFLGRVMYNYDSRYYITASIRADGSSKFPTDNKFAIFPAVSLAWRIIGEPFMENQNVFTNLKLRAGWGRVGNQNIDNNAYLTLLGSADYVFGDTPVRVPGTTISTVGNNSLRWETVEDWNIGLDMSFLESRLGVTFDAFRKTSKDMLYKKLNIYSTGYPEWNAPVWSNIGSMRAQGWELALTWQDQVSDFSYDLGVNLSSVKNTAIKFSGDGSVDTGKFNQDNIIRNEDGGEISRFYGYVADGIFQNMTEINAHTDEHGNLIQPNAVPGDIRFLDLDHSGTLDEKDKTWIGKAFPDLTLGLNMRFAYKGIDLTANFYGTFGNDVFNTTKARYSGASGSNIYAGTLLKAWHGEGTGNDIPRLSAKDNNLNYTRISSFFVEDGSYFRCKLLQIGYTLPFGRLKDMSVRFSLSAQNLFTFTRYSGLDPERPQLSNSVIETGIDWASYPNPRTFLFGLEFKF